MTTLTRDITLYKIFIRHDSWHVIQNMTSDKTSTMTNKMAPDMISNIEMT